MRLLSRFLGIGTLASSSLFVPTVYQETATPSVVAQLESKVGEPTYKLTDVERRLYEEHKGDNTESLMKGFQDAAPNSALRHYILDHTEVSTREDSLYKLLKIAADDGDIDVFCRIIIDFGVDPYALCSDCQTYVETIKCRVNYTTPHEKSQMIESALSKFKKNRKFTEKDFIFSSIKMFFRPGVNKTQIPIGRFFLASFGLMPEDNAVPSKFELRWMTRLGFLGKMYLKVLYGQELIHSKAFFGNRSASDRLSSWIDPSRRIFDIYVTYPPKKPEDFLRLAFFFYQCDQETAFKELFNTQPVKWALGRGGVEHLFLSRVPKYLEGTSQTVGSLALLENMPRLLILCLNNGASPVRILDECLKVKGAFESPIPSNTEPILVLLKTDLPKSQLNDLLGLFANDSDMAKLLIEKGAKITKKNFLQVVRLLDKELLFNHIKENRDEYDIDVFITWAEEFHYGFNRLIAESESRIEKANLKPKNKDSRIIRRHAKMILNMVKRSQKSAEVNIVTPLKEIKEKLKE